MLNVLIISLASAFCVISPAESALKEQINKEFSSVKGEFAVAFKDLQSGKELLINERKSFHAASTMKTPVMIEVYEQVSSKKFSLTDSLTVHQTFRSIADGSAFVLDQASDSDQELYALMGSKVDIYNLLYRMIIQSSNLATNMIIELVGADKVNQTMRKLGANDIQVLRGVEDIKAYEKGLSNTTTAYDQMLIYSALATGKIAGTESSQAMITILLDQKFNDVIPAKLSKEVKVPHKTGSITGIQHDAGIVYLPDGRKYVLVLLSKSLEDEKAGKEAMAKVSEMIYQSMRFNELMR
ncbi:MAG TPA: serine hydrolase [Daejeonella sp.]|nr:serine hydrolase [Daejeonella sp.]